MKTFVYLLLLWSLQVKAQENATISVKGQATISVKPTETVITCTIESAKSSYAEAIEDMTKRVDQLTSDLKKLKFKETQILTSMFNVHKRMNYNQNRNGEEIFVATQSLVVRFSQSKERLLEVINAATSSTSTPEIAISFDLDTEKKKALQTELIKLAVQDAQEKAKLIAGAANYQVGGIKEMSYGNSFASPRPMYAMADVSLKEVSISNFEVANLSFSETVDVVFYISE